MMLTWIFQMPHDYYAMTDQAIAEEMGRRIEQIRLESDISQYQIANNIGISETTYRQAIKGKAKLVVIIGILRVLNRLDNLDNFLPKTPYSPIARKKMEGKKRRRASSKRDMNTGDDPSW
tara:strand:+ start:289 stop:648 length:360 start_codon:yes stop_codon:yes gene_type:complete